MFNDMIVVVEDLRNVEFNLILVDKRSKLRLKKNSGGNGSINSGSQQQKSSPGVPILEYHSYPLPRITGSRSSLKVSQGNFDPNTFTVSPAAGKGFIRMNFFRQAYKIVKNGHF